MTLLKQNDSMTKLSMCLNSRVGYCLKNDDNVMNTFEVILISIEYFILYPAH